MATCCEGNLATLDDVLAFLTWCGKESPSVVNQVFDERRVLEDIDDLLDGAVKGAAVIERVELQELREKRVTSSENNPTLPSKKKPRVRRASSSSTALQRRRKYEIQTLQEEALKLEGYLNQLKKRGYHRRRHTERTNLPYEKGEKTRVMNRQRAIDEYQERLLSEQANIRLKEIFHHQERVCKTLNGIFRRRNLDESI
ncbi:Hypothetical protein PHPALM_6107 [Phytophthora palmivora]|uniref:Uncharacterized protein n=1 Tax=Phytophthora palmivora TaxID=4796 RepID=A0A2P4YFR5_9STRA|nr:Hypothetical protein PHPALM_6107 [Phytophthora palmivora]